MQLIRPDPSYKIAYVDFLQEYLPFDAAAYQEEIDNADIYIERQQQNIPAHRDYWLIDRERILGHFQLRPENRTGTQAYYTVRPSCRRQGIGKAILQLGKSAAVQLGMTVIDITCRPENMASRKIIERNGGRLVATKPNERGEMLHFFRIEL